MHLNAISLIFAISSLAAALPLEGAVNPRELHTRTKTYAIVNVDGGSTSAPPKPTTVVENTTKTVKVTDVPATTTDKVTTTATPTCTSTPKSSPSTPAQQTPAPTPSVVTIIVTESAAPTEYYDDGLWHTRYPVKTFATAVAVPASA
jgi:hypothetical protein